MLSSPPIPDKNNKSDQALEEIPATQQSGVVVDESESVDNPMFDITIQTDLSRLPDRSIISLGKALHDTSQREFINQVMDNEGSVSVLYAYIMASPAQRNTAMGWLATMVSDEDWKQSGMKQLPVPQEDQLYISPVSGLYRFYTLGEKKYLPHFSVELLASMILAGIHATTTSLLPGGLVDGSPVRVCDSAVRGRCINALLSMISKIEPDKLLRNVTSLEEAQSLTHEALITLLSNGSLDLESIATENVNFTQGNFFNETHATGALTDLTVSYEQVALFTALVFGVNYGPAIVRAALLPLFVKSSNAVQMFYKRMLARTTCIKGEDTINALGAALLKYPEMHNPVGKLITETKKNDMDVIALLSGIKQLDTQLFFNTWSRIDEQKRNANEDIIKTILHSTKTLLPPEPSSHGHLIQDVNDLLHKRGNRAKLVSNIAANLTSVIITGLVVYGVTEWVNQLVLMNPLAVIHEVEFPATCQNWTARQDNIHGVNCSLVDGTLEHIELPFYQHVAFNLVVTSMSLLSADIRGILRGGFKMTYEMASSLFRTALFMLTCMGGCGGEGGDMPLEADPMKETTLKMSGLQITD